MDWSPYPWMGGYHEWVATDSSSTRNLSVSLIQVVDI
jgi:hypothetical protein